MANLQSTNNLSDVDSIPTSRANLGFPADTNRYLRNNGAGVPAALGAAESANLDEISAVDPGTTGKDLLAASTPKASRTRQAIFDAVVDLLSDTSLSYTLAAGKVLIAANDTVEAGIHRYRVAASAATDYHVITAGSVKLYVLVGALGAMHAMAFGAIADNTERALSTRYATLAAAQAAYPRTHAAALAYAAVSPAEAKVFPAIDLTDQIDWACAQECILAAGGTLNIPSVQLGFGNYRINRTLHAGGAGRGLVIFGTAFTSPQQGSSKAGTCIRYNGVVTDPDTLLPAPQPILRIRGTHCYPENLSFENFGNADCAVDMTGPTSTTGIGRNNMRNISVQEASGTFPYQTAVFRIHNGSDYTAWENIEYAGTSPVVIDLAGAGDVPGGTTCFSLNRSVFSFVTGSPSVPIGLKVSTTNAERIMVRHTSFNNIRTTGGLTAVDTMNIGTVDVDNLVFEFSETDTLSNDTNVMFAKLKNVNLAHFKNSIGSGFGGSTCLIELTNSVAHLSDLAVHAINGPVVNCLDSVSRVSASGNFYIPSARGISNTSTANITQVTQAASVTLYGIETLIGAEKIHTYEFPLTTNANMTIISRPTGTAPEGRWRIGQKICWTVKNTIGGAAGTITFSTGFKIAAYTPPANGFNNSFFTEWNGTHHVQRGAFSPDIAN